MMWGVHRTKDGVTLMCVPNPTGASHPSQVKSGSMLGTEDKGTEDAYSHPKQMESNTKLHTPV